jgi:hypothetical protein
VLVGILGFVSDEHTTLVPWLIVRDCFLANFLSANDQ